MSLEFNPDNLKPADPIIDGPKILQRADVVWSKIELKQHEYLLVKVSAHLSDQMDDIKELIDHCFKRDNDKVLIYIDGDIEFSKVTFGEKKISDHRFA